MTVYGIALKVASIIRHALQSYEMVAKWEESKKWQQMNERLKERVKSKEEEVKGLYEKIEMLKHALDRCVNDSMHYCWYLYMYLNFTLSCCAWLLVVHGLRTVAWR